MPALPPERKLFASYKLWRTHADPDGLVSADEFAEMDDDEKREALRELGGPLPATPGAAAADDEDDDAPDGADGEEDDEHDDDLVPLAHGDEPDDPLEGDTMELTDDIADPRTLDH